MDDDQKLDYEAWRGLRLVDPVEAVRVASEGRVTDMPQRLVDAFRGQHQATRLGEVFRSPKSDGAPVGIAKWQAEVDTINKQARLDARREQQWQSEQEDEQ